MIFVLLVKKYLSVEFKQYFEVYYQMKQMEKHLSVEFNILRYLIKCWNDVPFYIVFLDKLSKVCKQLALLRCFLISVYGNFTHDILNIWLLQKFSLLFIAWVIILTLVLLPFDPSMMSASDEALRYTDLRINIDYLIPIKIRAPLIFA